METTTKNKITIDLECTNVFKRNFKAWNDYRILLNQGGSRSSKTYSLMQLLLVKMSTRKHDILNIFRKTLPALKTSVLDDFKQIMTDSFGGFDPVAWNKNEMEYHFGTNLIRFGSLDRPQKKRGAKRAILWMNEANEFTFEDFTQLAMRTTDKIILDFNPSDEFHWLYDKVKPREDCKFILSTYLDNPFIDDNVKKEIEHLKSVDENYWRIYGLGLQGKSQQKIYNNWEVVSKFPESFDEEMIGVDFGYNNPSAVVYVGIKDRDIYVRELLYASLLTTPELINKIKETLDEKLSKFPIYADSAEPDRIEEIRRAGIFIKPAKKGQNSVKDGIDQLKARKIFIHEESPNVIKEIKNYAWRQDKDGNLLDEPIKFNDHSMDAIRYAVYRDKKEPKLRWV